MVVVGSSSPSSVIQEQEQGEEEQEAEASRSRSAVEEQPGNKEDPRWVTGGCNEEVRSPPCQDGAKTRNNKERDFFAH